MRTFYFSPLTLLVIIATSIVSVARAETGLSANPQKQIVHSISPGGDTISFRTLPNARCILHPVGEGPDPSRGLTIYSDDSGIVRMGAQPISAGNHARLAIDCADQRGKKFAHTLEVNLDSHALAQTPVAFESRGMKHLPPLHGDPLAWSREQLHAAGYPPRPDSKKLPAQYAKWLDLVKKEPVMIVPRPMTEPWRKHGPARADFTSGGTATTSSNWSGYVITTDDSAAQYGEIFGSWNVPKVSGQSGFFNTNYSTLWVGMDGWGTPDVVQAGTSQDTYTVFWIQFSVYGAWTEWYPLYSQSISNFPVNPGDEIYCWVWVATQQDSWSPNGGWGWFYLWNVTQNVASGYLSTQAPKGTVFNGHQAEWVMERPEVLGSLTSLANYGQAEIRDAWAYDYNFGFHSYTSDNSIQVNMYNGNHLLSTVSPLDSMSMLFKWFNHN